MANVSGYTKLVKLIEQLREQVDTVRENAESKRDWLYDTSDSYQESDAYSDWEDHLDEVDELIERLENEPITDIEL